MSNIATLKTKVDYFKKEADRLKNPAMKALMLQQAQLAQAEINEFEATKSDAFWAEIEAKYANQSDMVEETTEETKKTPTRRGRKAKSTEENH